MPTKLVLTPKPHADPLLILTNLETEPTNIQIKKTWNIRIEESNIKEVRNNIKLFVKSNRATYRTEKSILIAN